MKIFTTISVASIFVFSFFLIPIASAHEYQNTGPYHVLLHVEPNDDPAVNETTHLYFNFEDKSDTLNLLQGCDCSLEISKENEHEGEEIEMNSKGGDSPAEDSDVVLLSEKIADDPSLKIEERNISVAFIFPEKGEYSVHLSGKPMYEKTFESFDLSYAVDVERDQNEPISFKNQFLGLFRGHFLHQDHLLHILIFGGGLLAWLVYLIQYKEKI